MWSFQLLKIRGILEANPNQVVQMSVLPTLIMVIMGYDMRIKTFATLLAKEALVSVKE